MTTVQRLVTFIAIVGVVLIVIFLVRKEEVIAPETVGKLIGTNGVPVLPFVEEHSTTTYAIMDSEYPKSSPSEYPEIYTFVKNAQKDFLENYANPTDPFIIESIVRHGEKYNFTLVTHIATSTKTVTYMLELYEETGGAHGGTSITTFTYDKQGKRIGLNDVFSVSQKEYLSKIAPLARTYMANKLGDNTTKEMLNPGTEPKEENFSSWYLTDDTITFIFGQYQVGPYVIGFQEFPLKKSDVSNILSSTFK